MSHEEIRKKYIDFFVKRGHKEIPSASLIPEHDPTTLFISAGMHPLVPYLLGEPHPLGKRLVNFQKCLRMDDVDSVGDGFHHTFFEMLGNWSLGDYFKKEAISLSFEFLISKDWLGLDPKRIYISVFAGDKDAPRDEESIKAWRKEFLKAGIKAKVGERIFLFGKKENWWGPVGETGPCGPCTEMFYDTGKPKCGPNCNPSCQCGKYVEIWNDVFMEYNRKADGKYEPLKQKNVDTGMGVERVVAVTSGFGDDDYQTELFLPIIKKIEEISGKNYQASNLKPQTSDKSFRIITDHLRAAIFVIADGVSPSNKDQAYVLRRLIRRAIRHGHLLGIDTLFTEELAKVVISNYHHIYPELSKNKDKILGELSLEEEKFRKTLQRGLREIEKHKTLNGKIAFYLYETYGFPLEMTQEIAQERGQKVKKEVFEKEFKKHQELSRKGAEKKFAGGLSDRSEEVTRLHTATHLLHQALRDVLGPHIQQKGSNITPKRLRFDFSHDKKLSESEIKRIERIVNEKIKEDLAVKMEIMTLSEAREKGARALFGQKYGERVKVYFIGDYSREVCGGPHVSSTKALGRFKIIKEESVGRGVRRVYAHV